MEILLSADTARRLRERLAAGEAGTAVRLTRRADGEWHLSFAPPEPTDHRGLIEDVPFAVEAAAAEDTEQLLVAWTGGRFLAGPIARHACDVDTEIRE